MIPPNLDSLKPTSEKQIAANRENAQNSTGPNTPDGKTTSSRNRRSHCGYVKELIPGENEDDFVAFWTGLEDQMDPQTPLEQYYFEEFAWGIWLVRRIRRQMTEVHRRIPDLLYRNAELHKLSQVLQRLERSRNKGKRDFDACRAEANAAQANSAPSSPAPPEAVEIPEDPYEELVDGLIARAKTNGNGQAPADHAASSPQPAQNGTPPAHPSGDSDDKMGSFRASATPASSPSDDSTA